MAAKYEPSVILDAIRAWTALFGEPPTAEEWSGPKVRGPERDARYRATGRAWPSREAAVTAFGSWSKALKAAGVKRQRRTHCKHGHKLSGRNLYITPDGQRQCRACARVANRRNRARANPLPLESLPPTLRRKIEAEKSGVM